MIGPELVLTCAYNVNNDGIGLLRKDSMRFRPGMNCRDATYGNVAIKEVYYPEEYKDKYYSVQSGSTLYIEESGDYYVFGIHVRGANSEFLSNQAVFLNGDR